VEQAYFPIASAIRPSVPTMTRHHANSVKPWRVIVGTLGLIALAMGR